MEMTAARTESTGEAILEGSPGTEKSGKPVLRITRGEKKGGGQDLHPQASLSPARCHRLKAHHMEFARAFSDNLSMTMRKEFRIDLVKIEVEPYSKAVAAFPLKTCLAIIKLQPMSGFGLCEISPKLGAAVIDRMLGGAGAAAEKEDEFTEMEQSLLRRFANLMVREYAKGWERFQKLEWQVAGYESSASFLAIIPSEASVLWIEFEAKFGDIKEKIHLLIPFLSVEKIIEQLLGGLSHETAAAPPLTPPANHSNPCENISIPVSAHWRGLSLTLEQLRDLAVGDLLSFDAARCEQVFVDLARIPKFLGRLENKDHRATITLLSKTPEIL